MALSLLPPPQNAWDRTLPNPALLPNGLDTRRSSSLLQHHISSDQFLTPAADESGKRNTLPCLAGPENGQESMGVEEEHLRRRQGSVISGRSVAESSSEGTSPPGNADLCLCVPEPKIPRPRNAFILYRQHQHAGVVAQHPGLPNPDISKIIGEQWRQLPPKEKGEWQALAEQEKARHSQQFPDYRYRPKRNGKYQPGDSSSSGNQSTSCNKCGGKTMNPPHPPHYPSYDPHHSSVVSVARPVKRAHTEAHVQPARAHPIAQTAPHPHTATMRYSFGSPVPPRHDSVHYIRGLPPPPQYIAMEGPEAKRRRMDGGYGPRPSYDHALYERDRGSVPHHPDTVPHHTMPPPARTSHPPPPPLGTPTRPPHPGPPRRDPSLTLPPLKTRTPPKPAPSPSNPTQRTSVESMIMSYPVLTKLKTLHSITPAVAASGSGSPSPKARGAIIAVEGLDSRRVFDMTASLVEQLEKEGKFLVKVFTGPDPYPALQSSQRANFGHADEVVSTEKYLNIISAWHQVSKEVTEFINRKPSNVDFGHDHEMSNVSAKTEHKPKSPFDRSPTNKSPISAVSPKTSVGKMSLDTPAREKAPEGGISTAHVTRSQTPQLRLDEEELKGTVPTPLPPPPGSWSPKTPPLPLEKESPVHQDTTQLIPVALVPHYQLTTVDACAIALPITDNYDPLTHWRWHATLWRGCVGPDISVVIKTAHEQHEDDALAETKKTKGPEGEHRRTGSVAGPTRPSDIAPSGAPPISAVPPAAPAPAPFGVEVRLRDHRAVIVRTGSSRWKSNASDAGCEKEIEKENENWEKAKRRVGFEVEECLRR